MLCWNTITCEGDACPGLKQDWWEHDARPLSAVIGRCDREPVGVVRLCHVHLELPGVVAIQCLGIGGVFVRPEYRQQGLAGRMLAAAIADRRFTDWPLALWARDGRLYETAGFQRLSEVEGHGTYCLPRGGITVEPHEGWRLRERF